jgi:LmbE family N-acetylglucosaminyl deacetylase
MMRNMAAEGRDLRVIWITDGARFVPAEVRRGESTVNMKRAGISKERLTFWDYPDGGAIRFASEIVERLTTAMREIGPGEVYTIAYEGGHPDHDFANFAAVKATSALDKEPPVYEAPCYNKHRARLCAFNRFIPAETETLYTPLSRDDLFFKLRAFISYRSQFWVTVLPALLLGNFELFSGGEPYRMVPAWNYRQPPHEGKLFYETLLLRWAAGVSFSDFREAVSSVLD